MPETKHISKSTHQAAHAGVIGAHVVIAASILYSQYYMGDTISRQNAKKIIYVAAAILLIASLLAIIPIASSKKYDIS